MAICCQEGKGAEGAVPLRSAPQMGARVLPDALLPLQIQKIIKEPAPDSGLLGLFQGQNPLLR